MSLNRYADDFVLCAQHEGEARRLLQTLRIRLLHCGLTLSEEKTRLITFGRYAEERSVSSGIPKGTFDYLGLTHYWKRPSRRKRRIGHCADRKKFGKRYAR